MSKNLIENQLNCYKTKKIKRKWLMMSLKLTVFIFFYVVIFCINEGITKEEDINSQAIIILFRESINIYK